MYKRIFTILLIVIFVFVVIINNYPTKIDELSYDDIFTNDCLFAFSFYSYSLFEENVFRQFKYRNAYIFALYDNGDLKTFYGNQDVSYQGGYDGIQENDKNLTFPLKEAKVITKTISKKKVNELINLANETVSIADDNASIPFVTHTGYFIIKLYIDEKIYAFAYKEDSKKSYILLAKKIMECSPVLVHVFTFPF